MNAPTAATVRLLLWGGLIVFVLGAGSCLVDDLKKFTEEQQLKQKAKLNELNDL